MRYAGRFSGVMPVAGYCWKSGEASVWPRLPDPSCTAPC
jgi:hypothetical protein